MVYAACTVPARVRAAVMARMAVRVFISCLSLILDERPAALRARRERRECAAAGTCHADRGAAAREIAEVGLRGRGVPGIGDMRVEGAGFGVR
jgi:hypothetical protein